MFHIPTCMIHHFLVSKDALGYFIIPPSFQSLRCSVDFRALLLRRRRSHVPCPSHLTRCFSHRPSLCSCSFRRHTIGSLSPHLYYRSLVPSLHPARTPTPPSRAFFHCPQPDARAPPPPIFPSMKRIR